MGEEHAQTIPPRNISAIKNKERRSKLYQEMKREKKKAKKKMKEKAKMEETGAEQEPAPKKTPRTLESMRVYDETRVDGNDEEVAMDECQDETSRHFREETSPKILITTSDRPCNRTNKFCKELKKVFGGDLFYRRGLDLKKIIKQAKSKNYTAILIVNEDQKEPNGLTVSHLPDGPTAQFKLSNVRLRPEIKKVGAMSSHPPEVMLNNFNTRLGHSVSRLLAALFPQCPDFSGRRVVTLHNQRDYIFFRQHRYMFRNEKRAGLQELGPRFTLKLRSLQKGTFDSKFGEYEWIHKRHEMETSRRKFFL